MLDPYPDARDRWTVEDAAHVPEDGPRGVVVEHGIVVEIAGRGPA